MTRRSVCLLILLAVTAGAVASLDGNNRSTVEPVVRPAAAPPASPPARVDIAALRTAPEERDPVDAFAAQSWTPAAAPAVKAKAVPPPMPYAYAGRMVDAGSTLVFLVSEDRVHTARVGDTLDSAWRVDEIADVAVTLTYLPLKVRQRLDTATDAGVEQR